MTGRDRLADNLATGSAALMVRQVAEILLALVTGALVLRHFGAHDFGVLSVAQALIAVVFLGAMNIESGLERLLPEYAARGEGDHVWASVVLAYVGRVGGTTLLAAGLIIPAQFWGRFYHNPAVTDILPGLALAGVAGAAASNGLIILVAFSRYRSALYISLMTGVLALAVAAAAVLFNMTMHAFVVWSAVVSLMTAIAATVSAIRAVPGPYRCDMAAIRRVRQRTIRYAGPLFGSRIVFEIYRNAGQLVLGYTGTFAGAGIFTFAKGILEKLVAIATSFHGAALPLLAAQSADDGARVEAAVATLSRVATLVAGAASAALFVLAPEVARTLGGPAFQGAEWVLRAFALQSFVRVAVQPYWTLMYVRDETWFILACSIGRLIIEVVLLVLLVPTLGLWGAVIAHIAGFASMPLPLYWWVCRRLGMPVAPVIGHQIRTLLACSLTGLLLLAIPGPWSTMTAVLLMLGKGLLVALTFFALSVLVRALTTADMTVWSRVRVGPIDLAPVERWTRRYIPLLRPLE